MTYSLKSKNRQRLTCLGNESGGSLRKSSGRGPRRGGTQPLCLWRGVLRSSPLLSTVSALGTALLLQSQQQYGINCTYQKHRLILSHEYLFSILWREYRI